MAQEKPSILDEGIPRRMGLGDACGAYAAFATGTSVVLGILFTVGAWMFGQPVAIGACAVVAGPVVMVPMGCSAIAIVWKLRLGEKYSAKLRKGDFRFAGLFTPLLVWGVAAVGEYILDLPGGTAVAEAFVMPFLIAGATTFFALQDRGQRRTVEPPSQEQDPEKKRGE